AMLHERIEPLGEHRDIEHAEPRNLVGLGTRLSTKHGGIRVLRRLNATPDGCLITAPCRSECRQREEQRSRVVTVHPAQPARTLFSHAGPVAPRLRGARCTESRHGRSMYRSAEDTAPLADSADNS